MYKYEKICFFSLAIVALNSVPINFFVSARDLSAQVFSFCVCVYVILLNFSCLFLFLSLSIVYRMLSCLPLPSKALLRLPFLSSLEGPSYLKQKLSQSLEAKHFVFKYVKSLSQTYLHFCVASIFFPYHFTDYFSRL